MNPVLAQADLADCNQDTVGELDDAPTPRPGTIDGLKDVGITREGALPVLSCFVDRSAWISICVSFVAPARGDYKAPHGLATPYVIAESLIQRERQETTESIMLKSRLLTLGIAALLVAAGCGDDSAVSNQNNGNGNQVYLLCGNGQPDGLEECDDGPDNSDADPDACRTDCTLARCGDGVVDQGESCDDGRQNHDGIPDACRTDCSLPACGDGVVDVATGETCDPGVDEPGDTCDAQCHVILCGNGILQGAEVCDDGNLEVGDGCSVDCQSDETCGNAYLDLATGEQCDDGGVTSGDGCSDTCQLEHCGNGVIDPFEVCDDGNNDDLDGCSANCLSDETCGNGYADVGLGEVCDLQAGNSDAPNAICRTDCLPRRCGDGILDDASGESCDLSVLGSGSCADFGFYRGAVTCDASCTYDTTGCSGECGDGVVDVTDGELCDGAFPSGFSCLNYGYDAGPLDCNAICAPAVQQCAFFDWRPEVLPVNQTLRAVWMAADGQAFAVGNAGLVLHFNGYFWVPMYTQTSPTLLGVWGSGVNDVFAVGGDAGAGEIHHFDGSTWSAMTVPAGVNTLRGVFGFSASEVYAVGDDAVLHYDGTAWTALVPPLANPWRAVWGSSPTDLVIVGEGGQILQYDGASFTTASVGSATTTLQGVWGASTSGVWAVGTGGEIFHRSGTAWSQMASPTTEDLTGVWGDGNGFYAVGDSLTVLRLSNSQWQLLDLGSTYSFYGVHGAAGHGVLAVGVSSRMFRSRRMYWEVNDDPLAATWLSTWGTGPDNYWVVGVDRTIRHFDGTTWTTQENTPGAASLQSIWGADANDIWAVGNAGTIYHYDGASWTDVPVAWSGVFYRVWGSAANDVYAVGDSSGVWHYDGTSWSRLTDPCFASTVLFEVWGTSANNVYVGGKLANNSANVLCRWTGTAWQTASLPPAGYVTGLWGSGPNDVFVGATVGRIYHWDGTSWTLMESGSTRSLNAVWGTGPSDVFAAGRDGELLHYDGSRWSRARSDTVEVLRDLFGFANWGVIVVGSQSYQRVLRYQANF